MTLNKKLALNGIIQILGKFVMIGIGFVSIRILTTFLGVDGFGTYITITNYLIIASVIAEFGFNALLTTEIAGKSEKQVAKIVSNLFTLSLIMAFRQNRLGFIKSNCRLQTQPLGSQLRRNKLVCVGNYQCYFKMSTAL